MRPAFLLALLSLTACSEPVASLQPGGLSLLLPIDGPAPVAPAALPVLTPCPPGWLAEAPPVADGPVTCEPWPAGKPAACAADEAHFPGEAGCSRLGTGCAGTFAAGLPATQVRYVLAGADGGSGTAAAPYGTIAAALVGATPGTVIAVGQGTYDEAVQLPANVTLWGACVGQTIISASTPNNVIGTVVPMGPGAVVKNLTLGGERPGVVAGVAGSSIELDDVAVLSPRGQGVVAANGARVTATNLLVRGVRAGASNGSGLYVEGAGSLVATRVSVEQTVGLGVVAFQAGSTIEATQVAVVRGVSMPAGSMGNAVEATRSGRVTLRQFVLEDNHEYALYSATSGVVVLEDGVVRDTAPRPSDLGVGNAFAALAGGRIEATRTLLDRNHSTTVYATDATTLITLTDAVVRGTLPETRSGGAGFGVVVMRGAHLEATRLAVQGAPANGIAVHLAGSNFAASDLTVLDTEGMALVGGSGDGMVVARGASAQLQRARFERNHSSGLASADPGTVVSLDDVLVRGTVADTLTGASSGLCAQDGASVRVHRGVVEQAQMLGLLLINASLDAEDLVVRDTRGLAGAGPVGRGAQVQEKGRLHVLRGVFEGNREAGVAAIDPGSVATLEHVVVRDTLKRDCLPTCPDEGGTGVVALREASISLTNFVVSGNAACGVELGDNGTMDLSEGLVSTNSIGVCMLTQGFDITRLEGGVRYSENATNYGGENLPLPEYHAPVNTQVSP